MFNSSNTNQTSILLKRLWHSYIGKHRNGLIFAVICMLLVAAATATQAYMLKPILDDVFIAKDATMIILVPIMIFFVGIILALSSYGQTVLMSNLGQSIVADMQIDLFSHLMHSDLAVFHDQAAGRLISRFTNDIMQMRNAVSNVLTGIARDFFSMIFLIGLMFYQNAELAVIAFVVFPVAVLPVIRMGRRMRKLSNSTQHQLGTLAAQLDETFNGIRAVKAYGREEYEITRASSIINTLHTLYIKGSRVRSAAAPIMDLLTNAAIAVVVWYGGREVLQGTTTPGAFFSFVGAMIMSYRPTKTLATLNNSLQEGLAAADRLFAVLDTKPTIFDQPNAQTLKVSGGAIRFENASFSYSPEVNAINDVTFDIPAGQTVALVGASGSGKSTIINLILRFYDLSRGMITVDNQDIRDVTLSSLRNAMSLVSQDIVLFDDTVRANIAYGRIDASDAEVVLAAKMAAADEFIQELPQGYDTMIGPHGVKLSGGQRQRLSIARAIIKNAPILLLDEATSSLDNTSERLVQEALEKMMKNRTTLVVAHRLSTIRNADIIYVLGGGKIVEVGNHDTLITKGGSYYALYAQSQAL